MMNRVYKIEEIEIREKELCGLKFLFEYKEFLGKYGSQNFHGLQFIELSELKHYGFKPNRKTNYLTESTPIAIDPLNNYLCLMHKYGASPYEENTKLMYANNYWKKGIPLSVSLSEYLEIYKTHVINKTEHTIEFFLALHDDTKIDKIVIEDLEIKKSKIALFLEKLLE